MVESELMDINQRGLLHYGRVTLKPIQFAKRIKFNDRVFANWNFEILRIRDELILEVMTTVMSETKKEDIPVSMEYLEYRSLWDHVKDIINKNVNVPKIFKPYLMVNRIAKMLSCVVKLEQYILYPSLDKNIPYVYTMNYKQVV